MHRLNCRVGRNDGEFISEDKNKLTGKSFPNRKTFTLIELLVVIAIISQGNPGLHHNLGSNMLFPDGRARWTAASEYLVNFNPHAYLGSTLTINYVLE